MFASTLLLTQLSLSLARSLYLSSVIIHSVFFSSGISVHSCVCLTSVTYMKCSEWSARTVDFWMMWSSRHTCTEGKAWISLQSLLSPAFLPATSAGYCCEFGIIMDGPICFQSGLTYLSFFFFLIPFGIFPSRTFMLFARLLRCVFTQTSSRACRSGLNYNVRQLNLLD